jgi:hypothetical protein
MSGLMMRGQLALIARQKAAFGRTVTLTRGSSSWSFAAWPGKTLFARNQEEPGASVVHGEADYLFAAADLVAAGMPWPPARGDRLTDPTVLDPLTGQPVVYEFSTPTGEPEWRYSDATRTVIRAHCKRAA